MEGLGYGEVDMDDAQRIDKLYEILKAQTEVLKTITREIALLKQQQSATVHHHYHTPGSPDKKFTSDLTSYGNVPGMGHWDSSSGGATA